MRIAVASWNEAHVGLRTARLTQGSRRLSSNEKGQQHLGKKNLQEASTQLPLPALAIDTESSEDGGPDETAPPSQQTQAMSEYGRSNVNLKSRFSSMSSNSSFKPGGSRGTKEKSVCPKCGAFVTFHRGSVDDRKFFCAACSGWFLINEEGQSQVTDSQRQLHNLHGRIQHVSHP